jgi:release factor glutamine methyltransferase
MTSGSAAPTTLRRLFEYARRRLAAGGVYSTETDARVLTLALLGLPRGAHVLFGDRPVTGGEVARVEVALARRLDGEPVARILGRKEFWGLDFALSGGTLVPRPDTEILVETALEISRAAAPPERVLDLGTGSSAILAALLSEWPEAFGVGVDRSWDAAATAARNLALLGLAPRAGVVVGDWCASLTGPFALIVSNPPYIATDEIAGLEIEVSRHDPVLALDGGADGLDAYRALIPAVAALLAPAGHLVLEIGETQEAEVIALLAGAGLTPEPAARRDLAGHPRVVVGRAITGV